MISPKDYHEALVATLTQFIHSLEGKHIAEVGVGSARDSLRLAEMGARSVAIDLSRAGLNVARQGMQKRGVKVHLVRGDAFRLPFAEDTFDVVFSQGLLEHFADPVPAILEQVRVLRPGGFLCVDVPQKWSLARLNAWWHIRRGTWFAGWETAYSLDELENLLVNNNLQVVTSYGWMYFPALLYGVRNLHTLDERHHMPFWINRALKERIESLWRWLENQRWYYRWLACIGAIGQKSTDT